MNTLYTKHKEKKNKYSQLIDTGLLGYFIIL